MCVAHDQEEYSLVVGPCLARPSAFSNGTFLPAQELLNSNAIVLLEPRSIRRDVPHTFQGRTSQRDEVTARVTVFATTSSLDDGAPTQVIDPCIVAYSMITSTLEQVMGGAIAGYVRRTATKSGSGFVLRDLEVATEAQVAAYIESREAEVVSALADVPSFD
jgi:hypothetical protein